MTVEPAPRRAQERYDRGAGRYDVTTRLLSRARRRAVDGLQIEPGATVLDIACGTGLNLGALQESVGANGTVVGIDISTGMLELARQRARRSGWSNVELIATDVAQAHLPSADAALFSFAHDVLRMPDAVERVMAAVKPGGRVAAAGVKYANPAALPVNAGVRMIAPRFITTREGLREPWSHLKGHVESLKIEKMLFGSLYVASGRSSSRR